MILRDNVISQMRNISVADIRSLLQRVDMNRSQTMIIDENAELIISNYFYIKYSGTSVARQAKKVVFPLFPDINQRFATLEGGEEKLGRKVILDDKKIVEDAIILNCQPQPVEMFAEIPDIFDFPLEADGDFVFRTQPYYFIPSLTLSDNCPSCNGEKYVLCDNPACNGKHHWECPDCRGSAKINCPDCQAHGYIKCKACGGKGEDKCATCLGSAKVKCSQCGGDGYIGKRKEDDSNRCPVCDARGWHTCRECHHGFIKCEVCYGKGELKCNTCRGTGYIGCNTCRNTGRIVCPKCYDDELKFGKIDCPVCKTTGKVANLVFVESVIQDHHHEKVICKNVKLNQISEEQILSFCSRNAREELCYSNINGIVQNQYDEFSGDFAPAIEKELKLNKETFPKLISESIYYEMIPCVHLAYKHMLTNTTHEFTIINFFANPGIIFHSEPEEIKAGIGTTVKSVKNVFGKLFKTKPYMTKQDKIFEIKLMIFVSKIDGVIKESEKEYIASYIGSLEDFTNSEKRELFKLTDITPPAIITRQDVQFSQYADKNQILSNLTKIALIDGSLEDSEKSLIENIRSFL